MTHYRAVANEHGLAVVLDHNDMSIVGVHHATNGEATPCFDELMAERVAHLLNTTSDVPGIIKSLHHRNEVLRQNLGALSTKAETAQKRERDTARELAKWTKRATAAEAQLKSLGVKSPQPQDTSETEYNQNGLREARTDEAIGRSLETQRRSLLALKTDWDGYGASPLSEGVVEPGADGSVQAEWHMRGDVDVEYCVTPGGKRCLYVRYCPLPASNPLQWKPTEEMK